MRKILIGSAITIVTGLVLAMTTWNFAATQGAVQKREHRTVHENLDNKIDKIQEGVDDIKNLILDLHTKNDRDDR